MSNDNKYFGKDCPVGKVQIEFVTTHSEKYSEYGWKPSDHATVDAYIVEQVLREFLNGRFKLKQGRRK